MKTFLKISNESIININNIVKITKATEKLNYVNKYIIRYYINTVNYINQYFDSKEERDIFFTNICNDLMY